MIMRALYERPAKSFNVRIVQRLRSAGYPATNFRSDPESKRFFSEGAVQYSFYLTLGGFFLAFNPYISSKNQ
jgi:hypothetical protein